MIADRTRAPIGEETGPGAHTKGETTAGITRHKAGARHR